MFPSFATATVIRERASETVNAHGDIQRSWVMPASLTIDGCVLVPGDSVEELDRREAVQVQWSVIAPPMVDVHFGDRVKVGGVPFAVVGEPQQWPSPTGALDHTLIRLSHWEG